MNMMLGLVTHPKSKYGDVNFKHNISHLVLNPESTVEVIVCDKDLSTKKIGIIDIARHYIFAVRLEGSYSNLFRAKSFSRKSYWKFLKFLRKLQQVLKIIIVITFNRQVRLIEIARLRRFDNINNAHLTIIEKAHESGVDSVMIFEDDARVQNPVALTDALRELSHVFSPSATSVIANISLSNSAVEMGVTHIVGSQEIHNLFVKSLIPFTNSASSNIYNAAFIRNFHTSWGKLVTRAMNHFIPIDWILNYIILNSENSGIDLSTLHMREPIAYQLSMNSNQVIFEISER
jgi:hypothetical protein